MRNNRIKDSILKRASQMWGYSDLESENSFDPVLELLLTAFASELEKLEFEQLHSQTRITERILEVLFPSQITGVVPAQTLLQIYPIENNTKLSFYDSFKTIKRKQPIYAPTQTISKELYFSPTLEVTLTTARIQYIAFGNRLIEKETIFLEEVIAHPEKDLPLGEYWVGIKYSNPAPLEDLTFYIELNNTYQKELFFHYLKQAKVYVGDKEFSLEEGFNESINHLDYESVITRNYNNVESLYNEVNQHYWDNFFTLKGVLPIEKTLGKLLLETYFPTLKTRIEDDLIWIKFQFYEVIGSDVFENMKIALNCVPAINIHNTQVSKRIKGRLNIIPILGENHFLDIDYVLDDEGKRYDTKSYDPNHSISVVLRRTGISRFDERSALEYIQQLLGIIKDETAAFSVLGNDVIGEELKQIAQNLASIDQIVKEKNLVLNTNPFVIISGENKEKDMNCTLSYWHTAGAEGNEVKSGTSLEKIKHNKTAIKDVTVIKSSFGGRDAISTQDKILEYRHSMLTRGRIVTIADIKVFGKNHFKNSILSLEIHKGTKKEVSIKGGFRRTIDIYLTKNLEVTQKMTSSEWEYLKESFQIKLEKASSNAYPYRIFEK